MLCLVQDDWQVNSGGIWQISNDFQLPCGVHDKIRNRRSREYSKKVSHVLRNLSSIDCKLEASLMCLGFLPVLSGLYTFLTFHAERKPIVLVANSKDSIVVDGELEVKLTARRL